MHLTERIRKSAIRYIVIIPMIMHRKDIFPVYGK